MTRQEEQAVKVEATRAAEPPSEHTLSPLVDIYEKEDEVVLAAEVPGAAAGAISVQVEKGVLTLTASTSSAAPEGYARTYVGFEPGQYFRAFALSDEIDRERIHATVANGVVTIHLPKAEQAKTRRIEIEVGG